MGVCFNTFNIEYLSPNSKYTIFVNRKSKSFPKTNNNSNDIHVDMSRCGVPA